MATGNFCKQVVVEFDNSLLSRFTVAQWNAFVDGLMSMNLAPTVWSSGERPPPFGVSLDFSGLRRRNYRLDGADLSLCWLADSDFTATLRVVSKLLNICKEASKTTAKQCVCVLHHLRSTR